MDVLIVKFGIVGIGIALGFLCLLGFALFVRFTEHRKPNKQPQNDLADASTGHPNALPDESRINALKGDTDELLETPGYPVMRPRPDVFPESPGKCYEVGITLENKVISWRGALTFFPFAGPIFAKYDEPIEYDMKLAYPREDIVVDPGYEFAPFYPLFGIEEGPFHPENTYRP